MSSLDEINGHLSLLLDHLKRMRPEGGYIVDIHLDTVESDSTPDDEVGPAVAKICISPMEYLQIARQTDYLQELVIWVDGDGWEFQLEIEDHADSNLPDHAKFPLDTDCVVIVQEIDKMLGQWRDVLTEMSSMENDIDQI